MAGFDALSVRDLVALTVIASRTIAQYHVNDPDQLVTEAFAVADSFVALSEGRWAKGARANHHAHREEQKHDPP